MALTAEERAELAGLIKSEYNHDVDLSQLNDDEVVELVEGLKGTSPEAPSPQSQPVDMGRQVRAGTAGLINALTLGNLSEMLPEEAAQALSKLKSQEPVASGIGQGVGTAATFMYPAGAISKIPAVAKAIQGSTKLKLAADVAGGAATGAGYGLLTNPESSDQLDARLKQAKTGAMLGAGFGTIPTILTKGGEAYFKSPFRKIDAALVKAGKKPISDVLWKRKITGSLSGIEDELQNVLDTELYPEIEKVKQGLKDKGYQYDIEDVRKLVMNNLPKAEKDSGIANEIDAVKGYATDAFNRYTPDGWMQTLRSYVNKRKGYEKEKAAFEAFGGSGDQLPIDNLAAQRTFKPGPKVVELQGKPANTMTAEPYDPSYVQQDLLDLPVLPEDRFNPLRAEKDLLGLSQRKSLADTFNRAMSENPINNKRMTAQGKGNIDSIVNAVKKKRIDIKQGNALLAAEFNKIMQQGPKQAEILNTGVVDKTYDIAQGMPYEVGTFGQQPFPIAPQKPKVPSKKMTVDDYDLLMKRIGQKGKNGFVQTVAGQQAPIPADLMADFYGALKGQREAAVGEQLGTEAANKYKAVNQETSTILNSFKKLSDAAQNEAATNTITPIEGMFLLNPATAKYAMTKEGIELLRSPYFATKIGKAMNKVGSSSLAPTNPVPFFLRKNEKAQEQ